MRTIRTKIYKFAELTPTAQDAALDNLRDINVMDDWYLSTYEDAENIGLKITSFDIDRGSYCKGEFILSAHEVAANIIRDHGEMCRTNRTAQTFIDDFNGIELTDGNEYGEGKEWESQAMEITHEFLTSLCEDYRIMLQNQYEYLYTDDAVKETIESNAYEFTKNGNRF